MSSDPSVPVPPEMHALDRRLPPASLLIFSVNSITQLLPLVILGLISGKADFGQIGFWLLIALLAVVLGALNWFSFRYRVGRDQISSRSGLIFRKQRLLKFAQVQNLSVVRTLLHRLLGLSLVRIESGSGAGDDIRLDGVTQAQVIELQAMIRGEHAADSTSTAPDPVLLKLGTLELVRLGLISNRGMLVVAALFGYLVQSGDERSMRANMSWLIDPIWAQYQGAHLSYMGTALAVLSMLLVALIAVRLLSVGLSILQFHGFELSARPDRVLGRYGLLTRIQAALKFERIQQVAIEQSLLHRGFGRASIRVRSAAQQAANEGVQQLAWLAPVIRAGRVDELLKRIQPQVEWGQFKWQPLAGDALYLVLVQRLAWFSVFFAVLAVVFKLKALWALLLLPVVCFSAWLYVRRTRIHVSAQSVAVFHGGINHLTLASRVGRIQTIAIRQGPLDRAFGLASVDVDVAGSMGAGLRQLVLPLLEVERARLLAKQLLEHA